MAEIRLKQDRLRAIAIRCSHTNSQALAGQILCQSQQARLSLSHSLGLRVGCIHPGEDRRAGCAHQAQLCVRPVRL